MMILICQELTILTSTQRTTLPHLITDMDYFKTIMTMVIRHNPNLVQDLILRDSDEKNNYQSKILVLIDNVARVSECQRDWRKSYWRESGSRPQALTFFVPQIQILNRDRDVYRI